MNYFEIKDLCKSLMVADSAADVTELLDAKGLWKDDTAWRPFGDNENNFGTIGNQQNEAVAALVEKLVNSIDARLMNLASMKGLTPEASDCPQDMREAIARLVENKKGKLGERDGNIFFWDNTQIREESQNIALVATGFKPGEGNLCLTISDTGEGQVPDQFPETLMSIGKQNKMRIPFVQGKFNMGGTGAFQFCQGDNRSQIQLVISRRNPELLPLDATSRDSEWGYTVVRRVSKDGARNPMFEYLTPLKGEVLSFPATSWPIFPSQSKDRPMPYAREATYGTLIKLYEYACSPYGTNIVMGTRALYRKIEEALPESALPIQVVECREYGGRDARSFVNEIVGSVNRLRAQDEEDRKKTLETDAPITGIVTLEGSFLPIQVFVFKEDPESKPYNAKGVFFTINGQTHAHKEASFFTRKQVNLSYIKDSLFVLVDCTNMTPDVRSDLFMNSRDRMRDNPAAKELEAKVEKFLGEDPTLQTINKRRRDERVKRALEDQKPLEETLKKLVRENPLLANLLPFGAKIPTTQTGSGTGSTGSEVFEGKQHPTYFRFKGGKSEISRGIPINQSARIAFETDAADDYFSRLSANGTLTIKIGDQLGNPIQADMRIGNLHSGILNIVLDIPVHHCKVGDVLHYEFRIYDEILLNPFVNELDLRIGGHEATNSHGGSGKAVAPNLGKGLEGGTKAAGLPNIVPVGRAEWNDFGFHDTSALQVKSNPGDEGFDFFYNKDNKYLLSQQATSKLDPKVLDYQYKVGLMLIALAIIDRANKVLKGMELEFLNPDTDIEGLVSEVTEAVSPYWLSIVEGLGGMSTMLLLDDRDTA